MRFAIIGAGAMGSLVGAMLAKAGAEVWLVNRNEPIVRAVRAEGLTVTWPDGTERLALNAAQAPGEIPGKMDVLIFLVKGCHTAAAAQAAQCLADERTYVMTLQNGIGNAEILERYYARERILYGLLEFAGKMLAPGHVQGLISANSKICFGPLTKAVNEDMRQIADFFKPSGIKIILREDVDSEVWIKLRNNSANVLFGLLRLSIGQGLAVAGCAELVQLIRNEVIAVARAKGIQFTSEELQVNGGKTAVNPELYAHLPSTAQDMKNKKPTEVEFLNGAIYREGLKLGVPTPYNELLYRLVKIYENGYEMQF